MGKTIAIKLQKISHRKVLIWIPIYLTITVTPASVAGEMDIQPEESVFETGTEADVKKEIDRRSITISPTDEDAKEIELNVHLDSFTWEAYRRATLQVAKSDKNMVLFDVLGKLANAEINPPVIAGCERLFRDPQFKSGLPPSFPVRKYAQWVVAIYYYQMLDFVAGRIVDPSLGNPSAANAHDQNYYFVYKHRAELEKFSWEVARIYGVEDGEKWR